MSKQDLRTPFIPPHLPKQPFQVGVAPDGQAIWADPLDFAVTPDTQEKLKDNFKAAHFTAQLEAAARAINQAIETWLDETMRQIMPDHLYHASREGQPDGAKAWLKANGYTIHHECVQGEVRVILFKQGSESSRFTARIKDFKQ